MELLIGEAYGTYRGAILYVAVDVDRLLTHDNGHWQERACGARINWVHLAGVTTEDLWRKWDVTAAELDRAINSRVHERRNIKRESTRRSGAGERALAYDVLAILKARGTGRCFAAEYLAEFYDNADDPNSQVNGMRNWERFKQRLGPRGVPHSRGSDCEGGGSNGTASGVQQVYIQLKPEAKAWAEQVLKRKVRMRRFNAEVFEFRVGTDEKWVSGHRPVVRLAVREVRKTLKTFLMIRMGIVRHADEMRELAKSINEAADFLETKIAKKVGKLA